MDHSSRGGQVLIEFSIALVGLVVLIYVILKCWVWMSEMVILRQRSFQDTRLSAGQDGADSGAPVPYEPRKLKFDLIRFRQR